jgi:hypothetical protein
VLALALFLLLPLALNSKGDHKALKTMSEVMQGWRQPRPNGNTCSTTAGTCTKTCDLAKVVCVKTFVNGPQQACKVLHQSVILAAAGTSTAHTRRSPTAKATLSRLLVELFPTLFWLLLTFVGILVE